MKAVLISTYDLGHQPFGLASPSAWLQERGADVACIDLAVQQFDAQAEKSVWQADAVGFYLPMHTATRIAVDVIKKVRMINPAAHICAYGLYAPMNNDLLKKLGVDTVIGGEFEEELTAAMFGTGREASPAQEKRLPKLQFRIPNRAELPSLSKYAFLTLPDGSTRQVGYTEASRGCKHLCRHCPIVAVYDGQFRIVQQEVVSADIDQLVAAGAEHISFGDPDFFNSTKHAAVIVEGLHRRHPTTSYDVTIKIEHLLKHQALLLLLRDTGCAFVTSAVESVEDRVLNLLKKGHTRSDFFRVADLFQKLGLTLSPTFVAFTPWITTDGYRDLMECIAQLELVENVAPVQLGIRLLIPQGSRLLELIEVQEIITSFDEAALCYRWCHPDRRVDRLQHDVEEAVKEGLRRREDRSAIFERVWHALQTYSDVSLPTAQRAHRPVPYLSEAWYCCAEPTDEQMKPF